MNKPESLMDPAVDNTVFNNYFIHLLLMVIRHMPRGIPAADTDQIFPQVKRQGFNHIIKLTFSADLINGKTVVSGRSLGNLNPFVSIKPYRELWALECPLGLKTDLNGEIFPPLKILFALTLIVKKINSLDLDFFCAYADRIDFDFLPFKGVFLELSQNLPSITLVFNFPF